MYNKEKHLKQFDWKLFLYILLAISGLVIVVYIIINLGVYINPSVGG